MPALDEYGLNLRQRAFVDAYVANGGNGKQAALVAGYSKSNCEHRASILCGDAKIQKAIQMLRPKVEQTKLDVGKDWAIAKLMKEAEEGETSSARTNAVMGIAKLEGWIIDKSETKNVESFAEEIKRAQAARENIRLMKTGT